MRIMTRKRLQQRRARLTAGGILVTTLLELVAAVAETTVSDRETLAVIASLLDSGRVRLIGEFLAIDVQTALAV